MLLVHQAGSVKIGEVYRYTLTYTPTNDRILPTPSSLHVKIKNTSAIPLRAAWVHGPYALHTAAYPSSFNPHHKLENPKRDGEPQYEPMLKAGGSWLATLAVPEDIRETGADLGKPRQSMQSAGSAEDDGKGSVTWIIEIASQILFSTSASVNFEVLVGRDERSLDLGFAAVAGHGHGGPGQVQYHATEKERRKAREKGHVQTAGVYSKAVRLVVENTEVLWDKPPLPTKEEEDERHRQSNEEKKREGRDGETRRRRKKVHLVVVTHGLHSNLGADMLFLKESIDATVKQARVDAKKRKESYRKPSQNHKPDNTAEAAHESDDNNDNVDPSTEPLSGGQQDLKDAPEDFDGDEDTIVRGFPGNAVRTENGIQYLGKRLAKYILRFTYPDQPYLPVKKPLSRTITDTFKRDEDKAKRDGTPSHPGSSIRHPDTSKDAEELPYQFKSISFIGHSLGGLIQTYAIAYIHKHNPAFFEQIKPVNFICMSSPMLGLSNENPMYVKFALDFGLVGRTGQDLGLTWRAPTLARGGWNAVIGGLGAGQKDHKQEDEDPSTKPLLRILPTGPAHQVLRKFRNRTVYSNVVNDGIVPLRTSCLLFLDWRGLGKVDKARRENGLIGTVAEWGWAELTGQNSSAVTDTTVDRIPARRSVGGDDDEDDDVHVSVGDGETVPLPDENETAADNMRLTTRPSYDETSAPAHMGSGDSSHLSPNSAQQTKRPSQELGMWDNFLSYFRPRTPSPGQSAPQQRSKKTKAALRRGQTIHHEDTESDDTQNRGRAGTMDNPTMRPHMPHSHTGQVGKKRPKASRGDSLINNTAGEPDAPPKTTIFESAGDMLHPPLPSRQWITNPSSRARTIFHDRVYHPDDIPPPPPKRQPSRFSRSMSFSGEASVKSSQSSHLSADSQDSTADWAGMKVEEKIARAYHRDLSWRKVLVRLEPDAHNNIIVRRMFANAYGWPVVKHLCDTHFADTHAAKTRDEDEPARERAPALEAPVEGETTEEVAEQTARHVPERTTSETREARDEIADLKIPHHGASSSHSSNKLMVDSRPNSGMWDDAYFEGSDGDADDSDEVDDRNLVQKLINPMPIKKPEQAYQPPSSPNSTSKTNGEPTTPTTPTKRYTDGHRGLSPTTMKKSPGSIASTRSTFDSANVESPVIAKTITQEPDHLASTADVGLRKPVEEQISPVKPKAGSRPASSSFAEASAKTGTVQD